MGLEGSEAAVCSKSNVKKTRFTLYNAPANI